MVIDINKSASKAYKEYMATGGTLPFKQWMEREKTKGFLNYTGTNAVIPVNRPLNDGIQDVLRQMDEQAGYKFDLENKYIFGVHRNVWYGIGAGVVIITGILVYKHYKKS